MEKNQFNAGLPDIQKTKDERGVYIHRVGVSEVKVPITVTKKDGELLRTVADFSMEVGVEAEKKGTHMSRFTQVLMDHLDKEYISCKDFHRIAKEIAERLEAPISFFKVEMDYFLFKPSPVSKIAGIAPYRAWIELTYSPTMNEYHCLVGVKVVGQTYCPCSKEISEYDATIKKGKGAHAQHGNVTIEVLHDSRETIWFEDLIQIAEDSMSAPAYPVLKRADEKHVTIQGYENPCFVEDVLRNAYLKVDKHPHVAGFRIRVVNDEVIHFHKATGEVKKSFFQI